MKRNKKKKIPFKAYIMLECLIVMSCDLCFFHKLYVYIQKKININLKLHCFV